MRGDGNPRLAPRGDDGLAYGWFDAFFHQDRCRRRVGDTIVRDLSFAGG
jgi:hypothetical protein